MHFFSKRRVGELNSRISSDISQLQDLFTTTLAEFLRQVIIIVGGIALLAYTSWQLTLFMLAIVPAICILAVVFGKFIRRFSKQVQGQIADSNTIVEETLQGIFNVKAFANEHFEIGRYKAKTNEVVKTGIKSGTYQGMFISFIIFGLFGAMVAVIWKGALMIGEGFDVGICSPSYYIPVSSAAPYPGWRKPSPVSRKPWALPKTCSRSWTSRKRISVRWRRKTANSTSKARSAFSMWGSSIPPARI